jgi:hypothetical protein
MKWPSFFKRKRPDTDLISRYKRLRRIGRDLNITLIKQLPKVAVPECGKKLGIVKAGTLILNNDDEIAVIYDYCLYHYRRGNKTVIERYREQSPPPPDSEEMTLLNAMSDARCSVFRITETKPHQGAELLDLAYGGSLDLTDLSVAETGIPGTMGRILSLPDLNLSSGTMIPVPEPAFEQSIVPLIQKFLPESGPNAPPVLSAAQNAAFTALLLRISLHAGGEDNVFYTDMEHAE